VRLRGVGSVAVFGVVLYDARYWQVSARQSCLTVMALNGWLLIASLLMNAYNMVTIKVDTPVALALRRQKHVILP
jgi:hypothetical protein